MRHVHARQIFVEYLVKNFVWYGLDQDFWSTFVRFRKNSVRRPISSLKRTIEDQPPSVTVRFWKKMCRRIVDRPSPSAFNDFQPFAVRFQLWKKLSNHGLSYCIKKTELLYWFRIQLLNFSFVWSLFYDVIWHDTWSLSPNLSQITSGQWIFR